MFYWWYQWNIIIRINVSSKNRGEDNRCRKWGYSRRIVRKMTNVVLLNFCLCYIAGADLDIQDLFGRTALQMAISYGEANIAITLIGLGEKFQRAMSTAFLELVLIRLIQTLICKRCQSVICGRNASLPHVAVLQIDKYFEIFPLISYQWKEKWTIFNIPCLVQGQMWTSRMQIAQFHWYQQLQTDN